jgi:hypothetical protein
MPWPTKHGWARTPEYRAWKSMRARCENQRNPAFARYGGRGILVCERWHGEHGFENFLADVGPRPSPEHSIERIDNDGNYEPGNCRWATRVEQGSNKRNNATLTVNGETATISEWSRRTGIGRTTIRERLRVGRPVANAVGDQVDACQSHRRSDAAPGGNTDVGE